MLQEEQCPASEGVEGMQSRGFLIPTSSGLDPLDPLDLVLYSEGDLAGISIPIWDFVEFPLHRCSRMRVLCHLYHL